MLAPRMPGIMCPLNEAEQLEVASIRSLCGIPPSVRHHRHAAVRGNCTTPPARQPWWVVAAASPFLAQSRARIEAFCFWTRHWNSAHALLQTLREPLESGMWRFPVQKAAPITRPHSNSSWRPTPCPCGYYYGTGERCALPGKKKTVYVISRLSGPILDRVDIQMAVPPSLAHCRAKRANRRVQCRDTSLV